jgi:pyrroline-5-carboxylate reductase
MSGHEAPQFKSIVVIGAGKMGSALVEGWLKQGVDPHTLHLVDPALARDDSRWRGRGVGCHVAPGTLKDANPDLLVLAIKPQMMNRALPVLARFDHAGLTVLSIAAGTMLGTLQAAFPHAVCIRSMPNTPAAVGAGITACFGPQADAKQRAGITGLLAAVGQVVWVEREQDMDAVTAVSGSGPAYVFHLVEALAEAAEALGLPPETAMALARQTVIGSGRLLEQSDESAARLRQNVTSPGGTTEAGLAVLRESGKLAALMQATTRAAFDRSIALAASKTATKP